MEFNLLHFSGFISFVISITIPGFLGWLVYELRQLRKSVETLNIRTAVILKTSEFHDGRLKLLERGKRS